MGPNQLNDQNFPSFHVKEPWVEHYTQLSAGIFLEDSNPMRSITFKLTKINT
jgi:hypothetical protein